jgi:hypothetical protein
MSAIRYRRSRALGVTPLKKARVRAALRAAPRKSRRPWLPRARPWSRRWSTRTKCRQTGAVARVTEVRRIMVTQPRCAGARRDHGRERHDQTHRPASTKAPKCRTRYDWERHPLIKSHRRRAHVRVASIVLQPSPSRPCCQRRPQSARRRFCRSLRRPAGHALRRLRSKNRSRRPRPCRSDGRR